MILQSHFWAYIQKKTLIRKDTCTSMFTAGLFTIVRTWKQRKCLLTYEYLKKIWCIYTLKYYSAIKRNEILPFAATWIALDIIILNHT